jgi:hypothetical protein
MRAVLATLIIVMITLVYTCDDQVNNTKTKFHIVANKKSLWNERLLIF